MTTAAYEPGLLMRHLPAIYRNSPALSELLAAFESALLHADPEIEKTPALGDRIANLPYLFRPLPIEPESNESGMHDGEYTTPREFLPWIAAWVGLNPALIAMLENDEGSYETDEKSRLDAESTFRKVVANIVPLYASRGTSSFLEEALKLFMPEIDDVAIDDRDLPGFVLGATELGKSSWLVTYRPFHFRITIRFTRSQDDGSGDKRRERMLCRKAETIIDLSKPAHTTYDAEWRFA